MHKNSIYQQLVLKKVRILTIFGEIISYYETKLQKMSLRKEKKCVFWWTTTKNVRLLPFLRKITVYLHDQLKQKSYKIKKISCKKNVNFADFQRSCRIFTQPVAKNHSVQTGKNLRKSYKGPKRQNTEEQQIFCENSRK